MATVLALDLATTTGWAVNRADGPPAYGATRFARPGATDGEFFHRFDLWLSDMMTVHNPDVLVFEAPLFLSQDASNIATARRLLGLAAMTDMIAYRRDIHLVREVHHQSVKKHFTGSGRAKKADTIAACRRRGWAPKDDNAADALAILDYTLHILKLPGLLPGPMVKEAAE